MGPDNPNADSEGITPTDNYQGAESPSSPVALPQTIIESPLEIELPLESTGTFQHDVAVEIARARSHTENFFLKVTIVAVTASPIVVFIAMYALPNSHDVVKEIYERWMTVLAPLLGAAFGFGAMNAGGKSK